MENAYSHLFLRITILISVTSFFFLSVNAQTANRVAGSGSPTFSDGDHHHEECHHHHHDHDHESSVSQRRMLPEELAEEEVLIRERSAEHRHENDHLEHHDHRQLSDLGKFDCEMLLL